MKLKHTLLIILAAALTAVSIATCRPTGNRESVLVILDKEANDPVAESWERIFIRKAKKAHIKADIHFLHYGLHRGDEPKAQRLLTTKLNELSEAGMFPEVIISHGDLCQLLLLNSKDPRLAATQIVSYGVHFTKDDITTDSKIADNITYLLEDLDIKRNLDLMNTLWPDCHQFITELDWEYNWKDSLLRERLYEQMSQLDTNRYLNNIKLDIRESEMLDIAETEGKTSLYALSLHDPESNITPDGHKFQTQFVFSPLSSPNRVIFFKDDDNSRSLTENPEFPAFCTAIPAQFEQDVNCAGGYFTPSQIAIEQTLAAAKTAMLKPEAQKSVLTLQNDYYVNWRVLKDTHSLKDMPDYVNVMNASMREVDPVVWKIFVIVLSLIGTLLVLLTIYFMIVLHRRGTTIDRQLIKKAKANIQLEEEIRFVQEQAGSFVWSIEGDTFIIDKFNLQYSVSNGPEEIDPYFRDKCSEFLSINEPGIHRLQIFGPSPADATRRWYELRLHVSIKDGKIIKEGITVNIDDQKNAEAQLLESHRMLLNAQEKEDFISSISHEMRTPLNSVVGFSQLLTTPGITVSLEERNQMREAVIRSSEELTGIINDMLTLTRMDNGTAPIELSLCGPENLLSSNIQDLEKIAAMHEVKLEFIGGPTGHLIEVDARLFGIILHNIANNAAKFSDPGSKINIGWKEEGGEVIFFVKDHGIGIAKENIPLIFHRFFKVNSFTQGTGLGLAIAEEYMKQMGGRITVKSELGRGSTFYLHFDSVAKSEAL